MQFQLKNNTQSRKDLKKKSTTNLMKINHRGVFCKRNWKVLRIFRMVYIVSHHWTVYHVSCEIQQLSELKYKLKYNSRLIFHLEFHVARFKWIDLSSIMYWTWEWKRLNVPKLSDWFYCDEHNKFMIASGVFKILLVIQWIICAEPYFSYFFDQVTARAIERDKKRQQKNKKHGDKIFCIQQFSNCHITIVTY